MKISNHDGEPFELRNYLSKDLYRYVLDQVIPSRDMRRALLQEVDLAPRNAVSDVVNNAPVPIVAKLEVYKRLSSTDDFSNLPADFTDKGSIDYRSIWPWPEINWLHSYVKRELLRDYFSFNAACIDYALDALNLHFGVHFRLSCKEYNQDALNDKETKLGEFTDFESARKVIADYVKGRTDEELYWLQLDLYRENTSEKCFTYYFKDGQLTWLKGYRSSLYRHTFFDAVSCVNLPVPFKAGTIVTIDCRPFAPLTYAVILGNSRALYRDEMGTWIIDDISTFHPLRLHRLPVYSTEYSPLYNLSIFCGVLPEEFSFFKEISKTIHGSKRFAERFYMAFCNEMETRHGKSYFYWNYKNTDDLRRAFGEEHFHYPGLTDAEFKDLWNRFLLSHDFSGYPA